MSLEIMSFCDSDECLLLASVRVSGEKILTMNRRAKRSIIGLSAIDSASCQVVVRNSGNTSIGRCKVSRFGVSKFLSKVSNEEIAKTLRERMIQERLWQCDFWAIREELLRRLDSQEAAVKVEVCVSLPETVVCVAFTPGEWGLASGYYCTFRKRPNTMGCVWF